MPRHADIPQPLSPWRWLTHIAFAITIAVVIARFMTVEMLRDPFDPVPGGAAIPRGTGPATGLVFDLLATLPILLILARAAIDSHFNIPIRWSDLPLLLLGCLAVASTFWSADRFAAAINSSHLLAGFALLWSTSQLLRSWNRLRLISALAFGLLLVLVAQSVMYRFIDVPANTRYWNENRNQILKEHNWTSDSFAARQFEHKITSGEVSGFFASPNTLAAAAVLLFFAGAGIGLQKVLDGDPTPWLAWPAIAALGTGWIIFTARSKTAAATPILALVLLTILWLLRDTLQRHSRRFFTVGLIAVCLAGLAVISLGLSTGGLLPGHLSNSLDFRWKYWIAAARLLPRHPWLGIGWSNFGYSYLSTRLPQAAEEIKDPHNFLVRFAVELGAIGTALVIAWLLRLWWELTQHPLRQIQELESQAEPTTIGRLAAIISLGMAMNIAACIDFNQGPADDILELMRRLLYLLVLLLGTLTGAMLQPHVSALDNRPAPWVRRCILIAIGLMLIHNLIDFSMFEVGVMFTLFLLFGSALGITINPSHRHWPRILSATALGILTVAWLTAAGIFVWPVIAAEQLSYDASELIRTAPIDHPAESRQQFSHAAANLQAALDNVPYNFDYALQASRSFLSAGDLNSALPLIDRAITLNPLSIDALLLRANVNLRIHSSDAPAIQRDFETILKLNPNEVSLHQQYGQALEQLGQRPQAAQQFQIALSYDDQLPTGEPKRLSPQQRQQLQNQIQSDEKVISHR